MTEVTPMQLKQTALFATLSLIGGLIGGAIFSSGRIVANAQLGAQLSGTTQESGIQGGVKITSHNMIYVPVNGLKFVDPDMKVVAWLGVQGGATVFSLVGEDGSPSIVLTAGNGGKIDIRALPTGTGILATTPETGTTVGLYSDRNKAEMFTNAGGSGALVSSDNGRSLMSIRGPSQTPGFELSGDKAGGTMTLFGDSRLPVVTIGGSSVGGQINVRDTRGTTKASVNGEGKFTSIVDGKAVWQGPPKKGD